MKLGQYRLQLVSTLLSPIQTFTCLSFLHNYYIVELLQGVIQDFKVEGGNIRHSFKKSQLHVISIPWLVAIQAIDTQSYNITNT